MKAGSFYSSQGPEIHAFFQANGTAHVECSPAMNIALVGRGTRVVHKFGPGMTHVELPTEKFKGDWFRLVVTNDAGKAAWSNPVWLDRD